ncbi:LacI family DNA-binding transcriptional regulator [Streptomyces sp. NPDC058751]|uniref:LacI family DNA-binding transcriptional regulator n=1 Tax=Streptomyces sp. NPDC058751 TaxID=3346623 RepID=UPI00368417E3
MATMADVARRAGVSVATVSHVLNATRPVLPGTRQAVLDAIEELGYTPNALARSLVTSRTRSIGLAVPMSGDPCFTEILQGVEARALEHGYGLLVADPRDDPGHERKAVRLLHERRVDGVIIAPSTAPDALLGYLGRHDVPTVLLDRVVDAPAGSGFRHDQVCVENTAPTASLVAHLAELGHRRIGLVSGPPGTSTTAERITGYRHGLARAGLPYDERLVAHGDSRAEAAEEATHRLLSLGAPPGALVTAGGAMTVGALRALGDRGLSVPGDLALCCFDDFPWADLFAPRLTVAARPGKEIGATAVRLLLERLASPRLESRTVRLPSAFVHRTSCGCPAGAEAPLDRDTEERTQS